MTQSVFIHGPAGCGKTTNAEKLRKHFGLTQVIDDFWGGDRRRVPAEGALVIGQHSGEAPKNVRVMHYATACGMAGIPTKVVRP